MPYALFLRFRFRDFQGSPPSGILLGSVLTDFFSWRWVFLINVPIGLAVLAGTRILGEERTSAGTLHMFDAIAGSGAMFALAYGITRSGEHGWNDMVTLGTFIAFAMLGMVFLLLQRCRQHPMLLLDLFGDRNRSGSYLAVLFIGGGLMAAYYLLTLFMQQVLQFTPLMSGLAFLPVSVGIVLAAGTSTKLVERFAPRMVAVPGLLIAAWACSCFRF
jgi:predicted MFS family arabinose efflux permease